MIPTDMVLSLSGAVATLPRCLGEGHGELRPPAVLAAADPKRPADLFDQRLHDLHAKTLGRGRIEAFGQRRAFVANRQTKPALWRFLQPDGDDAYAMLGGIW